MGLSRLHKKYFYSCLFNLKLFFYHFPKKMNENIRFLDFFFGNSTFGVSQRIRVSKNQIKEIVYKWRNGRSSPGMRCLWEISIRSLLGETAQRPLRNLSKKMIFCDVFKTSQIHLKKDVYSVTSLRRFKNISSKYLWFFKNIPQKWLCYLIK